MARNPEDVPKVIRVEKRLGGYFFQSVRADHLYVLLPQLLRSLGYPREVFPGFFASFAWSLASGSDSMEPAVDELLNCTLV